MVSILVILLLYYLVTIGVRMLRTRFKRNRIRVGDACSIYLGENKFKAFVIEISNEIEVSVLSTIVKVPRELIYL